MAHRGGPRGNRWRAGAASIALVALLLSGCGGGDDDDDGEARVGDAARQDATTTSDTTTTAAPTTEPVATTGAGSPQESAQALYDAWKAGDRAGAAAVAETGAVEGIWATPPDDYALYSACDSAEFPTSGCLFRGPSGTIQLTMERRGDFWVVIEARFSPP